MDPWYGYTEAFKIAHHAYVVSCEESRHSLLKLPTMLGVVFATRGFNLFLCFSHEAIVYFLRTCGVQLLLHVVYRFMVLGEAKTICYFVAIYCRGNEKPPTSQQM